MYSLYLDLDFINGINLATDRIFLWFIVFPLVLFTVYICFRSLYLGLSLVLGKKGSSSIKNN